MSSTPPFATDARYRHAIDHATTQPFIGDQRLVRFNQSATGDRSDRSLKGYCLGDLKDDEGGVDKYMRQSAITYVALEFTWPNGKLATVATQVNIGGFDAISFAVSRWQIQWPRLRTSMT